MSTSNTSQALIIAGAAVVLPYLIAGASMALPQLIPDIKAAAVKIYGVVHDLIFSTIVIKQKQYVSFYAMKKELGTILGKTNTRVVMDDNNKPSYKPNYGTYCRKIAIPGHGSKYVIFCYQKKKITMCVCGSMTPLTAFFDHVYAKHNSPSMCVNYYTMKGENWSHPKFRMPRIVGSTAVTPSMQVVLDSVDVFRASQSEYGLDGRNFRIGYMLHGGPGTGKSSLAEIIAIKYNMGIYTVQLNSKDTTDGSLIDLCGSVPINSIIVFDEIDKQFDAVINNDTVHVSKSGILGAVDGVLKLPSGTIVIMTANSLAGFDKEFREQLFREGRIDNVIELTEKFH